MPRKILSLTDVKISALGPKAGSALPLDPLPLVPGECEVTCKPPARAFGLVAHVEQKRLRFVSAGGYSKPAAFALVEVVDPHAEEPAKQKEKAKPAPTP